MRLDDFDADELLGWRRKKILHPKEQAKIERLTADYGIKNPANRNVQKLVS